MSTTSRGKTILALIAELDQTSAAYEILQSRLANLIENVPMRSELRQQLMEAWSDLDRVLSAMENVILQTPS